MCQLYNRDTPSVAIIREDGNELGTISNPPSFQIASMDRSGRRWSELGCVIK